MKISMTLNDTTVWLIQSALQSAAMREAEALGAIRYGEYEQRKNEIDIRRQMVVEYLSLRNGIMRWWSKGESAEEAKKTMQQADEGTTEAVNAWNSHMRRIMRRIKKGNP